MATLTRREILLAVPAAALVAGCRPRGHAGGESIYLRGNGPDPDSLDPHRARSVESMVVLRDLFEGLTRIDRDGAPAPAAAARWTTSEDGTLYTFELHPGQKWSNGDPLVAADFVAGLRRLVDPATASQYAQVVAIIANAAEVIAGKKPVESLGATATDDHTVVIKLNSPAPYLPGLMAHPSTAPLHRASLDKFGEQFARPGSQVSNGAFVATEWLQGSYIRAARNVHYRENAANQLDGVKYIQLADENAELRAYRAGELHSTAVVPRGQFDWIRDNLGKELHIAPQLNTYYYGFNFDRPLFRDARVRRALSMAIDRERLATSVLRVGELPANGWVPQGTFNYTPQSFDYAAQPMAERIATAKQLLAEAGFGAAKPLRFELRYNTGEVHTKVAVAVASMWKEALGVEASLAAVEFKSLLDDVNRRDVDLFRLSWAGDYNDPYTFLQFLRSDFGINVSHYKNPEYDRVVEEAARQADVATRREMLQAAERMVLADHPLLPIYFYVNKHLVKPEVRGWYDNVLNVVYSRDLSLAPKAAS